MPLARVFLVLIPQLGLLLWIIFKIVVFVVFASSNFVNDTDVSFLAALPTYFNGTDDSVDLSDAWLSVMYADFIGSSISSTSDVQRRGNPCGAAKEWCLVVDDYQIKAAGFIDAGRVPVSIVL